MAPIARPDAVVVAQQAWVIEQIWVIERIAK
jgi:hypothetical protein